MEAKIEIFQRWHNIRICIVAPRITDRMLNTILLVDDSEIDNFITHRTLSLSKLAKNYVTKQSVNDAIDYLEELEKHHQPLPEIIFLDLNMPMLDGYAFLELFHTFPRDIIERTCIVILSSSSDLRDMQKTKRFKNVKEYFIKPLKADKLEMIESCYAEYVGHLQVA